MTPSHQGSPEANSVTNARGLCEVKEQFILGKRGEPQGGGDRLILGPRFYGIIDAATEKFKYEWRVKDRSVTGEAAMAVLLAENLTRSTDDLGAILNKTQHELQVAAHDSGITMGELGASPLAAFVLYDLYSGKLYLLGDCSDGFCSSHGFRDFCNERVVDRVAAEMRKRVIEERQWRGEDLDGEDPGRQAIMPHLLEAVGLANADPSQFAPTDQLYGVEKSRLVYTVFDATSAVVPQEISIPPGTTGLVLASDGYPKIFDTLADSESYLAHSLQSDPLRIGAHPSTKGVPKGGGSYDDRSYLRVSIVPST